MNPATRVELRKLTRSHVTLVATILMAALMPLMALGLYSVAGHGGTGPLAQKAQALLTGEGWEGYLEAVDQIAAVALFLGSGIVVAWGFGREFADRTFPSLFALPTSRATIARSKFTVLAAWSILVSVLVCVVSFGIGFVDGVGPLESNVIGPEILRLLAVAGSTSLLGLTTGLVASVGRGYLPAIGALIVTIAIAQVAVLFGTGGWFPFAVPGLIAASGADGVPTVNVAQVALVPITVAIAMWATVRWWHSTEVV